MRTNDIVIDVSFKTFDTMNSVSHVVRPRRTGIISWPAVTELCTSYHTATHNIRFLWPWYTEQTTEILAVAHSLRLYYTGLIKCSAAHRGHRIYIAVEAINADHIRGSYITAVR